MKRRKSSGSASRLVYSTEHPVDSDNGLAGKKSGKKKAGGRGSGIKSSGNIGLPNDGIVRVWLQTKGRKGKGVTAITGLGLPEAELTKLAKELKKTCGSGGTAKAGTVEIQGDHRDKIIDELRRRGFRVKKAGG